MKPSPVWFTAVVLLSVLQLVSSSSSSPPPSIPPHLPRGIFKRGKDYPRRFHSLLFHSSSLCRHSLHITSPHPPSPSSTITSKPAKGQPISQPQSQDSRSLSSTSTYVSKPEPPYPIFGGTATKTSQAHRQVGRWAHPYVR